MAQRKDENAVECAFSTLPEVRCGAKVTTKSDTADLEQCHSIRSFLSVHSARAAGIIAREGVLSGKRPAGRQHV